MVDCAIVLSFIWWHARARATACVNGGSSPYTYIWNSIPIQYSATIDSLVAPKTYTLTVTDAKNCTKQDSIMVDCPTGILKIVSGYTINLYPNPVRSTLSLIIENLDNENVEILISTIEGKQVQKETFNTQTKGKFLKDIDMNELADQLYIVQIKIKNETGLTP